MAEQSLTAPGVTPGGTAPARICVALYRAYRQLRLYPLDHPLAQDALTNLLNALAEYLADDDSLTLEIQERSLLHDGREVYTHRETEDNLAFIMFRDGLRSISFRAGVDPGEVEAFVTCLAQAEDLSRSGHDLVTALWERELSHIGYEAADPLLGGTILEPGMIDALRETVLRRLDHAELGLEAEIVPEVAMMNPIAPLEFDEKALGLSQDELARSECEAASKWDLVRDFGEILIEVLAIPSPAILDDETAANAVAYAVDTSLASRDLERALEVLEGIQRLEALGRVTAGLLGLVVTRVATVERLGRLLELVESGQEAQMRLAEELLAVMRWWSAPALMQILAEAQDRGIRRQALHLVRGEGGLPAWDLLPWLQDDRWYVLRNAAQLAAVTRDDSLIPALVRLLRHPDSRVRREAVRTLEAYGEKVPADALVRALSDDDPIVRTMAARQTARRVVPEAFPFLLEVTKSRDFDNRTEEEVGAMLAALAVSGSDQAVPVLDRIWRRRRVRARLMGVRAAAVDALGLIRHPDALRSLREAQASGEEAIRRAAAKSLRGTMPPPPVDAEAQLGDTDSEML